MKKYYKRLIEKEINLSLKAGGAVSLSGPKYCGKTTTAKRFAKSTLSLVEEQAIATASVDVNLALEGEKPRLIDEWQVLPNIWNVVRVMVDNADSSSQFILTRSSTPAQYDKIYHSGAGRIVPIVMRPMSLLETEDSDGSISLKELFKNPNAKIFNQNKSHDIKKIAYWICRGGWPDSLDKEKNIALKTTSNYYKSLFNLLSTDNPFYKNKNPEILKMVLRSYARNVSSEATQKTMVEDITSNENRNIHRDTFDTYADMLKDLFIIEDMDAWSPNLRSKAIVRTTKTRHFFDTSIACCALGIQPDTLLKDFNTFGLMFEDFAVRDLRIYADYLNGTVSHYRDNNGLECDCIFRLNNGKWAAIEIKLGGTIQEDVAAKNLIKLNNLTDNKNKPSFLMVLTANGPAYRRNDGVYSVPINLLGV